MATNKNIVNMIKAIRKGVGNSSSSFDGIYLAEVVSVSPLQIKTNDVLIDENIYIDSSLVFEEAAIDEKFSGYEGVVYEFLREFHKKYVIKKGDTVIVFVAGDSFFIAGKAEKV